MKVEEGPRGALLFDDFKSYRTNEVKEHVKIHKSGSYDDDDEDRHDLVDVHTLSGGTTPKAQPVDLFVGEVTKVHCRNYYDFHMLDTPVNPTTGHPLIPSHQLCTTWVVKAWDEVPETLIKRLGKLAIMQSTKICNEKVQTLATAR